MPLPAEDVELVRDLSCVCGSRGPAGWELYWPDRDSKFHLYEAVEPTQNVTLLLTEIDSDPTGIFFG